MLINVCWATTLKPQNDYCSWLQVENLSWKHSPLRNRFRQSHPSLCQSTLGITRLPAVVFILLTKTMTNYICQRPFSVTKTSFMKKRDEKAVNEFLKITKVPLSFCLRQKKEMKLWKYFLPSMQQFRFLWTARTVDLFWLCIQRRTRPGATWQRQAFGEKNEKLR